MSLLALFAALCLPTTPEVPVVLADGWTVEVAADLGEKLGAVAVGDVLLERPGLELVSVSVSGTVTVTSRDETGAWQSQMAVRLPGEMIQCAVGDLVPNVPGEEIVAVGMAEGDEESGGEGAAYLIARQAGGLWSAEEIMRAPALLHCAGLADLDGERGLEVLVAGFDLTATALFLSENGWNVLDAIDLPGAAKAATPWLGGLAIACRDGSIVKVRGTRRGLVSHPIHTFEAGQARIGSDMTRLLVAGDDGGLSLLTGPGTVTRQHVLQSTDKLRGAVIADVDGQGFGPELCTVGYDGLVVVAGAGEPRAVVDDGDRLHHLATGRIDGRPVLVACGYSGRVLVIRGPAARRRGN